MSDLVRVVLINLLDTRKGTINDDEPDDRLAINFLAPTYNVLPVV